MTGRVGWGILSTARINEPILAAAKESERAEVVAVASRDAARGGAYARTWGIERSYGGYDALLPDDGVEAGFVSLPNRPPAQGTLRGPGAGQDGPCGKPVLRPGAA